MARVRRIVEEDGIRFLTVEPAGRGFVGVTWVVAGLVSAALAVGSVSLAVRTNAAWAGGLALGGALVAMGLPFVAGTLAGRARITSDVLVGSRWLEIDGERVPYSRIRDLFPEGGGFVIDAGAERFVRDDDGQIYPALREARTAFVRDQLDAPTISAEDQARLQGMRGR